LQNVDVKSYKKQNIGTETKLEDYAPGLKIVSIDSATLLQYNQQNLATLLSQQLPVFVKSYGFNSLATLNFRGASAAQSQVLWEGIPLQNAASGIADVSLMPVALLDDVRAVYGSSAALLGSGNVGGAILLESKNPDFKHRKTGSLNIGFGSYRQLMVGGKGTISRNRWSATLKLFAQQAKNDFTYRDAQGNEKRMPNDSLSSASALARVYYKVNDYNTFTVQSWAQWFYRQIPPALFESYSVKEQQDDALRFVADWKHHKKENWYIKTAYLRDRLRYGDTTIHLESNSITHHLFSEAGWEKKLSVDQRLLVFLPLQLLFFNGSESHQQLKTAIAGAFHQSLLKQKLTLALNARAELINGKAIFLPGINGAYRASNWLKIQGNVQRTYRYPTLNELYYNPGGNKDLKPEQGWHMDAGYSVQKKIDNQLYFEHNAAIFNRYIDDWIIWLGGAIWTPHNLASVHSRGIETENKLLLNTGKIQWNLSANGSYTVATTTKSYIPNDNSIGKQIPYTPHINGQLNAGFNWKWFSLNYNHTYTSYRYITTDESQYLQPFNTGTLRASWQGDQRNIRLRLDIQCHNIGDQQYEVVGFRAMPGRNWLIGLTLSNIEK